jgi:hypothetical protein
MEEKKAGPLTVDDYIAQFPDDVQNILVKIRGSSRKLHQAPRKKSATKC